MESVVILIVSYLFYVATITLFNYNNVILGCNSVDACSNTNMSIVAPSSIETLSRFILQCFSATHPNQGCDSANITSTGYDINNILCGDTVNRRWGGCSNSNITISPKQQLQIECADCKNTQFNIIDDPTNNNTTTDITCCCNFGCIGANFTFSENNNINTNINCNSSSNWGCQNVNFMNISPFKNKTNLYCNGEGSTSSALPCQNVSISVPDTYYPDFINIEFTEGSGNQYISMSCNSGSVLNHLMIFQLLIMLYLQPQTHPVHILLVIHHIFINSEVLNVKVRMIVMSNVPSSKHAVICILPVIKPVQHHQPVILMQMQMVMNHHFYPQ